MSNRDFFAFCTSLKPIELKALGALSQVRHLPANETIYKAGDPSDTIYIINRGMVEIMRQNVAKSTASTYLSRGDIFGDVEVLTDLPRKYDARACEQVSLQCFQRNHMPDLVRRVPTFFHYLSEQLADRLLQARDAALSRSYCLELGGSLANFDLVTIYQTIVNSAQTGELSILDERGELVAVFYFESGQPRGGRFQHLAGEEAFGQLFLSEELRGTFSFSSGPRRMSQAIQEHDFEKNSDEMLINAVRGRDELRALRNEFAEPTARLRRAKSELTVSELSPALRSTAEELWYLTRSGALSLRDLYPKCSSCELKIHQAARELIETGHCALVSSGDIQKVA